MRKVWMILLAVLLLATPAVSAQETSRYRLHIPTVEEYLSAIPDIAEQFYTERGEYGSCFPIGTVDNVLWYRYPELIEQDFVLLDTAYDAMSQCLYSISWHQLLITSWLRQNDIDLDSTRTLEFGDYTLAVTPQDFDADGTNEWVVDARRGQEFQSYLVFRRDSEGFYRPIDTPLP